jgi:hypothetical protein
VTLPLVRSEKNAVEGLVCNMDLLLEMMTDKVSRIVCHNRVII